jgi:hypothetical protein
MNGRKATMRSDERRTKDVETDEEYEAEEKSNACLSF